MTTLLKVERVDLLVALFGRVLIPPAVAEELRAYHGTLPPGCEVRPVSHSPRLAGLLAQADQGEAEAICLAVETGADALLIDDRKARAWPKPRGCGAWDCPRWCWRPSNKG